MDDQAPTIRTAGPEDAEALRRLAGLDSTPPLTGRVLLAEVDGDPIAAVSLKTGAAVADPFRRSGDALALLIERRNRIVGQRSEARPARSVLRRLAPHHSE